MQRQAERLRPLSERFFREAGVRQGSRVLDLGSGIGDVAMLAAQIVGLSGEVVGVERDAASVEVARTRASEAGYANVTFVESDVSELSSAKPFDALIGRFILQFVADPVSVLRSASRLVSHEGIVAFQEVSWAPARAAARHLPLRSACADVVCDAMQRRGANPDIGLALNRIFQEAGLPAPKTTIDMQIGASGHVVLWLHDILLSMHGQAPLDDASNVVGDFETVGDRLLAEVRNSASLVTSNAVVGASSPRRAVVR